MSVSNKWYFALDGDNVGFSVEAEDLESNLRGAFSDLEDYVKEIGGEVLFQGGDNFIFTAQGDPKEIGNNVLVTFTNRSAHGASVGVALGIIEATKALSLGKHSRKGSITVWGEAEERAFNEIQAQDSEAESGLEEDNREEGEALDYRAEAHYRRLIGSGYDPRTAEVFVRQIYSDNYRDILENRKKNPLTGDTPVEAYLIDGETRLAEFIAEAEVENAKMESETEVTPVLEQKIVSKNSLGFVRFVGNRFVSVEWLNGQKERIALKNFKRAALAGDLKLVPKIRTARKHA